MSLETIIFSLVPRRLMTFKCKFVNAPKISQMKIASILLPLHSHKHTYTHIHKTKHKKKNKQ